MSVVFQFHESYTGVFSTPNKAGQLVESLFQFHDKNLLYINYFFCSDQFVLDLNKEYLDHDYFTDILTFDLSDEDHEVEADVFISIDRAMENAKNLDLDFDNELMRLVFHGALHLVGFDDKSKEDKELMTQEENVWVAKCFT